MARGGNISSGRSSGGSAGRSSGGRSGGMTSHRGGGTSRSSSSRGSGHRSAPTYGSHNHSHPSPLHYGYGWRHRTHGVDYNDRYTAGRRLPLIWFTMFFMVVMVIIANTSMWGSVNFFSFASGGNNSVTASTVKRTPLPSGSVVETNYYTDELDWIGNATQLTVGMKNFYKKTGVQPYLYITDTVNGTHIPSDADMETFAQAKYDTLFKDEAHLLLVFFEYEPSQYSAWYVAGKQAKTVLDSEAMDILLDYVDFYYYQDYSDEQFFSNAFDDAGKQIMTVKTSPWIPVLIIVGVVVLAVLLFVWWSRAKKQKNLEAEQTEKILNTSLESFGPDSEKI